MTETKYNPRVSVIIPTFNHPEYLSEAIKSVLGQTVKDFEIIVVDDGSTDNTRQMVEQYVKAWPEKVRYFYQENNGPAAARNTGLKNARANGYIAFLDHDDTWVPEKLEKQIGFLDSNPNIGMVYSDQYVFSNGKIIKEHVLNTNDIKLMSGSIIKRLLTGCFVPLGTVLVRKNAIDEIGLFNEGIYVVDDWDLLIRIANKYNVGFINESLVGRRLHADNLSSKIDLELTWRNRMINGLFDAGVIDNKYQRQRNICIGRNYFFTGREYLSKGNHYKARRLFLKSLWYHCITNETYLLFIKSCLPVSFLKKLKQIRQKIQQWKQF